MRATTARHCQGMTLIELMISMVLGLVIIGGATSVMLANQQSYRTNEALSQVQESQRSAFELLSRDVREAGFNGCNSRGRVANVLERRSPGPYWWQTWVGMQGFDGRQAGGAVSFGTAVGTRVEGTDSIVVQGVQGLGFGGRISSADLGDHQDHHAEHRHRFRRHRDPVRFRSCGDFSGQPVQQPKHDRGA